MTHSPPNPYCKACMYGKALRVGHRKGAFRKNDKIPTEEGELLNMDWMIFRSATSKGMKGEGALLDLLDVGTGFLTAHPTKTNDTDAAYRGITRASGGRCEVKYAYIDGGDELINACDMHGIPHKIAAPYIHQNNPTIESWNRIELYGCRVSLEQCGAPLCFWPYAAVHTAYSRNMWPVQGNPLSPYERKFKQGPFPGLRIPFFARVRFMQIPPHAKSKDTHKAGPTRIWRVLWMVYC